MCNYGRVHAAHIHEPLRWVDYVCLSRQWEGCPLGLGLVVENEPTEFSCTSLQLAKQLDSWGDTS